MEVLFQDLIPLVIALDDPHLPLAILRPDQFVIDHADPPVFRRQRADDAPPEMGVG